MGKVVFLSLAPKLSRLPTEALSWAKEALARGRNTLARGRKTLARGRNTPARGQDAQEAGKVKSPLLIREGLRQSF